MIEGDDGVFDVVVDGDLIFSKHELGCFPEDDEVVQTIRARAEPAAGRGP